MYLSKVIITYTFTTSSRPHSYQFCLTQAIYIISCVIDYAAKIPKSEKVKFLTKLYTNYLKEVEMLWYEIGVLLGVPFNKLDMIDKKSNKLKEVIEVNIQLTACLAKTQQ